MLYLGIFSSGLALIFFRFLIFSDFIKSSDENAVFYIGFAFWNAILPFAFFGVTMGQNALFPKLSKKHGNELANFYRTFLIAVASAAVIFFSSTYWIEYIFVYCYSLLQLVINMGYQQKRFEQASQGVALSCIEICVIVAFLFTAEPFHNLFLYYYVLACAFVMSQFGFFYRNFALLLLIERYVFHLKNILFKSPSLIRDNVDLIVLGLATKPDIAIIYASVVIASAPAKVIFSNIITILNIYLADNNRYYSDFSVKAQSFIYIIGACFTMLAVFLIVHFMFPNSSFEVHIATMVRSINLLMSAKLTTSYLDVIQENHEDIKFIPPTYKTLGAIICCYLVFNLYPSVLILSILGFIVGFFNFNVYKKNEHFS